MCKAQVFPCPPLESQSPARLYLEFRTPTHPPPLTDTNTGIQKMEALIDSTLIHGRGKGNQWHALLWWVLLSGDEQAQGKGVFLNTGDL